jgi:hypothetical protein
VFRRRRKGVDQAGGDEPAESDKAAFDELEADGQIADDYDEDDHGAGRPAGSGLQPEPSLADLGDPETWSRAQRAASQAALADRGQARESGPWDGAGTFPAGDRMDFGSLQVPAREGFEIQISMGEEQGTWIAVVRGDSGLQLQAFAAPKTSGLWAEDRQELAEEIVNSGGECEEAAGPFGAELHARLVPQVPGQRKPRPEPVRFLGVDGPRWFLRGVITGPAARRADLAAAFEEIFADVVVVRGDHPAPPRDLLEIQLPEEARQALEAQMEQEAGYVMPDPFERGPEITETR